MQDGFLRAAAASIPVAVADPRRNAAAVCARIDQAHRARAALLVLPELCVTGYTCGDLFLSALLLDAAEEALLNICAHTQNCDPVVVLGVPLRAGGKLYNCAAVLHRGRILGVVPKTWLPNYDVFAEKRCFASAAAYHGPGSVPVSGADVPFGTGLVFACAQMPAFRLGVELCEDVWAPVPPSVRLCLAGATVIANILPAKTVELHHSCSMPQTWGAGQKKEAGGRNREGGSSIRIQEGEGCPVTGIHHLIHEAQRCRLGS